MSGDTTLVRIIIFACGQRPKLQVNTFKFVALLGKFVVLLGQFLLLEMVKIEQTRWSQVTLPAMANFYLNLSLEIQNTKLVWKCDWANAFRLNCNRHILTLPLPLPTFLSRSRNYDNSSSLCYSFAKNLTSPLSVVDWGTTTTTTTMMVGDRNFELNGT